MQTLARFDTAVGCLVILAGVLINEWTLAKALQFESLGPRSRLLVWSWSLGALAWGAVTIGYRGSPAVRTANLLLLSLAFSAVSAEFLLRAFPTVLGHPFANGILTKYTTDPGGIYYWDRSAKMRFMIPNFKTRMYYNGYVWQHQTDRLGFRNREVRIPADLLLLGDSLIYGHGVNFEHTVGQALEQCSGRSVMNLARQGDGPYEEGYLLTQYVGLFRPRVVFYFFFENDILDLYYGKHGPAEMARFTDTPLDAITYPPRTDPTLALQQREQAWRNSARMDSTLEWVRWHTYLGKIPDWIRFQAESRELLQRIAEEGVYDGNNEDSLGWKYTKHTILYMKRLSEMHQATFVMAPITPDNPHHYEILARFAREHGIPFVDTSRLTFRANPGLFLVEDGDLGHFAPAGARAMADALCGYLSQAGAVAATPAPSQRLVNR